jgi:uncharacterized protein
MSREYPDWLDPRKAAEGRRTYSGTMQLDRMTRLRPLLAGGGGEARFAAGFAFDPQARVTISIEVDADLPLICQRTLEPYLEPVHRQTLLGVMESMAEESLMPENYEPVLVENGRLGLLELVEDELLLGMPQVPKKPEAGVGKAGMGPEDFRGPTRRPFAGLAEQLKKFGQKKEQSR